MCRWCMIAELLRINFKPFQLEVIFRLKLVTFRWNLFFLFYSTWTVLWSIYFHCFLSYAPYAINESILKPVLKGLINLSILQLNVIHIKCTESIFHLTQFRPIGMQMEREGRQKKKILECHQYMERWEVRENIMAFSWVTGQIPKLRIILHP